MTVAAPVSDTSAFVQLESFTGVTETTGYVAAPALVLFGSGAAGFNLTEPNTVGIVAANLDDSSLGLVNTTSLAVGTGDGTPGIATSGGNVIIDVMNGNTLTLPNDLGVNAIDTTTILPAPATDGSVLLEADSIDLGTTGTMLAVMPASTPAPSPAR